MPLWESDGTRRAYKAEAAITALRVVKEGTDDGEVDVCGANEKPLGVAPQAISADEWGPVQLDGIVLVTASGAVTRGDWVEVAADGKVASIGTTVDNTEHALGIALSAASADGDTISVQIIKVSGPSA